MFTEVAPPTSRKVTATASLASDLSWLLSVAARPVMQTRYPQLAEMFNGREDLAERVRSFWSMGSDESCFAELQVLAHHVGALGQTDPGALWEALEGAIKTIPLQLEMPSESPEELALFVERFRQLKRSSKLLRAWLELLQEVWGPVDAMWQQALPLMEESGRHVVAQFERGRSLHSLVTPGCDIFRDRLPEIARNVDAGQPLLFVPCLFFGTSMFLEFPDLVVIGTGVGQGDGLARARTESVARRLKAVADPTRLALLHSLATAPSTVGELAQSFRLAQPTVSMHVKVLRQSGLVRSEREAGKLRLSADSEAVEALLGDLRRAVLQGQERGHTAR
jgi:ArsR family transcriptional regulator, cadmium/lead-responsive transcriptional repressor